MDDACVNPANGKPQSVECLHGKDACLSESDEEKLGVATRLVEAGRRPDLTGPFVNPPVVRASTVLFDTVADMNSGNAPYTYGRRGTPTIVALENALTSITADAAGTVICPSGLSALTTTAFAFIEAGCHMLLPDCVYGPYRHFADTMLTRLGIAVEYYDAIAGAAGIEGRLRPDTRLIHVESPGSNTFEVVDLPAIVALAKRSDAFVVVDNTWATPLFHQPLALGADVMVLSATKYVGGHADIMLGTATANERAYKQLRNTHGANGTTAGPDDIYLALRGLRTMKVRLDRHQESALTVARWLLDRPEVAAVLHPSLFNGQGHTIWQRDFTGSSGLFAFILGGWSEAEAAAFLDGLHHFGLGYSWGGFESLAILVSRDLKRTATPWRPAGPVIRMHVGLEDPADLIADLEQALTRAKPR
ncbi:MAG: cystathionine beta-lyase [Bauldia sp.]|nr:cystathionine beta-lyase [Bauldia sp.]